MKVIRKLLLWSLLLWIPALLAGGAYGYYWYQVSQLAEAVRQQLAPVAQLKYAGLQADLDGVIAFNQVRLTPARGPQIELEQVRLSGPDALFWLNARRRLQDGEWPAQLKLDLLGLKVPVTAASLPAAEAGLPGWQSPQALACGEQRQFTVKELQAIGYRTLSLDMTLVLTQPASQRLELEMAADIARMGKLELQLRASYRGQPRDAYSLMQADPQLEFVSFAYQDAGYNQRRNRWCARESGVSEADYLAAHRQALQEWAAEVFAVQVPAPVLDAYMQLQAPRARLNIAMRPQLNPVQLAAQPPQPDVLLEQLQLKISINRQPFAWQQLLEISPAQAPGLGAELDKILPEKAPQPAASAEPAAEPEVGEELFEPQVLPVKPQRQAGYKTVPWVQLGDWLGEPVRLRTLMGRKIQGTLQAFEGSRIQVLYRVEQGSAVFPVNREQIQSIEVYDRGR